MNKNELRKKYLLIRKEVQDKLDKSNSIFNKIINSEEYKTSRVIGLYKNLPSEVDTNELIDYSLKNRKIVLLPRVEGDSLVFYRVFNNSDFEKSSFGIDEPIPEPANYFSRIDLLIVPGICFDKSRNRIGFGKGYYDRFLDDKNIRTIGVCFDEQISDDIEVEEHDKKLDKVITDKRIFF